MNHTNYDLTRYCIPSVASSYAPSLIYALAMSGVTWSKICKISFPVKFRPRELVHISKAIGYRIKMTFYNKEHKLTTLSFGKGTESIAINYYKKHFFIDEITDKQQLATVPELNDEDGYAVVELIPEKFFTSLDLIKMFYEQKLIKF